MSERPEDSFEKLRAKTTVAWSCQPVRRPAAGGWQLVPYAVFVRVGKPSV